MRRKGFTLIELLVVLTIFGILIALLIPAVVNGRHAAKRTVCQNNLKQISLALLVYQHEYQVFPPGYLADGGTNDAGWGWPAFALPSMEQSALAGSIQTDLPVMHPDNHHAVIAQLNVFYCKADGGTPPEFVVKTTIDKLPVSASLPLTSYVGSFGTGDPDSAADRDRSDGVFARNSRVTLDMIFDGTSETFLVGERTQDAGFSTWAGVVEGTGTSQPGVPKRSQKLGPSMVLGSTFGDRGPNGKPARLGQYASNHEGGAYFAFADGGVRFIRNEIGRPVYQALATRNGGEIVPGPEE